jgi:hypothetical protein
MHVQHVTFYNNVVGNASYDWSVHCCLKSPTYSSQVIVQLASGLVRQETGLLLSLSYIAGGRQDRKKPQKIMRHIVWKELQLMHAMFYAQYDTLCTLVHCSTMGKPLIHFNWVQCHGYWYNEVRSELLTHFIFNMGLKKLVQITCFPLHKLMCKVQKYH